MEFFRDILRNYSANPVAYLGGARKKRNHGRIVPGHSAFWKRNNPVTKAHRWPVLFWTWLPGMFAVKPFRELRSAISVEQGGGACLLPARLELGVSPRVRRRYAK